jgi:hypothetical protein
MVVGVKVIPCRKSRGINTGTGISGLKRLTRPRGGVWIPDI